MASRLGRASWVVWLRRGIQTAMLLLFVYLFIQTTFHPINTTGGWVTLFFELDPLILGAVWIATRVVVPALLLSLITLAITVLFGRWFCGWICPFGVLHNICTSLRGGKLKAKLDVGGYSRAQRFKYLALAVLLVGALWGVNLTGWLDPFSFFYRSLATAVFPVFQTGGQGLRVWLYQANLGVGPVRTAAVSDLLHRYILAPDQPHYFWGIGIGALFVLVVALNFYRASGAAMSARSARSWGLRARIRSCVSRRRRRSATTAVSVRAIARAAPIRM
jgi:hypothetical protein